MLDRKDTDWRAIALATLVTVFLSAVVGGLWGLFSLWSFLATLDRPVESLVSTAARISGFLYSLVPVVLGTRFLIWLVCDNQGKHCLLLGIVFTGITLVFGFAARSFAWHDILFYLAIVPTTLLTCRSSQGNRRVR